MSDTTILSFAILSLGAFVAVLVAAIGYYLLAEREASAEDDDTLHAGGGAQLDELKTRLSDIQTQLDQTPDQVGLQETIEKIQTQLLDINQRLTTGFDVQSKIAVDAKSIYKEMPVFGTRFDLLNQQINALADQLIQQDAILQAIHRQVNGTETLYGLISQQAVFINQMAGKFDAGIPNDAELTQYGHLLDGMQAQLRQQHAELQDLIRHQTGLIHQNTTQESEYKALLEQVREKLDDIDTDVDVIKARKPTSAKRLTDIKGVGPVYAGLLHEAGIHNFEQLAALSLEELRNLVKVPSWRRINAEEWLEQARLFASQQDKLEGEA